MSIYQKIGPVNSQVFMDNSHRLKYSHLSVSHVHSTLLQHYTHIYICNFNKTHLKD